MSREISFKWDFFFLWIILIQVSGSALLDLFRELEREKNLKVSDTMAHFIDDMMFIFMATEVLPEKLFWRSLSFASCWPREIIIIFPSMSFSYSFDTFSLFSSCIHLFFAESLPNIEW